MFKLLFQFIISNITIITPVIRTNINKNGHLPEIPKVTEIEEGINLGEMNNKLLQKIEELTLYVIDLQKQVNDLKSQLNEQ